MLRDYQIPDLCSLKAMPESDAYSGFGDKNVLFQYLSIFAVLCLMGHLSTVIYSLLPDWMITLTYKTG